MPRSEETMSLSWPTDKVNAARVTAAGTLRFLAGSLSNHPKSPASSPPRRFVSQSEHSLHLAVNAEAPIIDNSGSKRSNCSSASNAVRDALGLPRSSCDVQPVCRNKMCRHRTFVNRAASVRARFAAGVAASLVLQPKRTMPQASGDTAPPRRASLRTVTQAALGRSDIVWARTSARSRVGPSPGALRTPSTLSRTPRWLSSKTPQCVETSSPKPAMSTSSMPPSAPPSLPKRQHMAPPAAARVTLPPRTRAMASESFATPISEASWETDSATTCSSLSFSQFPLCCASRGRSRTCKPLAADSAKAPPAAPS
mmetsp:Transcript_13210/g.38032  ORF Transcript_13210/g.38032 Transcript_13210/m.38032 type:complete len:312 (+) Transcript_13210:85-1020(+)